MITKTLTSKLLTSTANTSLLDFSLNLYGSGSTGHASPYGSGGHSSPAPKPCPCPPTPPVNDPPVPGDMIFGGSLDDTITGGASDDEIHGGAGNDTIDGGGGKDKIFGDEDNDLIHGGTGDDTIDGGTGHDQIYGDDGNDNLKGGDGDDTLDGGQGNDVMDGGAGEDTASYASATGAVTVDLSKTGAQDTKSAGCDTLKNIENLVGSDYNDTLTGNDGANKIDGGQGNDKIDGKGGNDEIRGGTGNDTLTGGKGNDAFMFTAADGNDCITDFKGLGTSHTSPVGNCEYDTLVFQNPVFIVPGEPHFTAGKMLLSVVGCDLKITFENLCDFSVTLKNFQLQNLENFADGDAKRNIIFTSGGGFEAQFITDPYDVVNCNVKDLNLSTSTLYRAPVIFMNDNNNHVIGRDTDDVINAQGGNDKVYGKAGDDTLRGEAGNDQLFGEAGDDTLEGGPGNDKLDGGEGNDTASYENLVLASGNVGVTVDLTKIGAQDTVKAGCDTLCSIENLVGSKYDDKLTGDEGPNKIEGGKGNDTIDSKGGDDIVLGGDGDDKIVGGGGSDDIHGGAGADEITATGVSEVHGDSGNDTITVVGDGDYVGGDVLHAIHGDSGDDIIISEGSFNYLEGNDDNDLLGSGIGDDTLDGGAGNDTVSYAHLVLAGPDGVEVDLNVQDIAQNTLNAGNDTLISIENLTGSQYDDKLTGDGSANVIKGLAGKDTIDSSTGADSIDAGANDDIIMGNSSHLTNAVLIDGGADDGIDTSGYGVDDNDKFVVNTTGDLLDFTVSSPIKNIGIIDLGSSGNNQVNLDVSSVEAMSSTSHNLYIDGDNTDTVQTTTPSDWTLAGSGITAGPDGNTYDVYQDATMTTNLFIEQGVLHNL